MGARGEEICRHKTRELLTWPDASSLLYADTNIEVVLTLFTQVQPQIGDIFSRLSQERGELYKESSSAHMHYVWNAVLSNTICRSSRSNRLKKSRIVSVRLLTYVIGKSLRMYISTCSGKTTPRTPAETIRDHREFSANTKISIFLSEYALRWLLVDLVRCTSGGYIDEV